MADEKSPKNLTDDEMKELALAQGRKLGILISGLNMSDEALEALMFLVSEMNPEQIDRLTEILENKYADEKTRDIDEKLIKELRGIKDDFDADMAKAGADAMAALEELEKSLPAGA